MASIKHLCLWDKNRLQPAFYPTYKKTINWIILFNPDPSLQEFPNNKLNAVLASTKIIKLFMFKYFLLISFFVVLVFTSCTSTRKTAYFYNVQDTTFYSAGGNQQVPIQPNNILKEITWKRFKNE
jgi:hypothetical protein